MIYFPKCEGKGSFPKSQIKALNYEQEMPQSHLVECFKIWLIEEETVEHRQIKTQKQECNMKSFRFHSGTLIGFGK